jgi:hypothetical protein
MKLYNLYTYYNRVLLESLDKEITPSMMHLFHIGHSWEYLCEQNEYRAMQAKALREKGEAICLNAA